MLWFTLIPIFIIIQIRQIIAATNLIVNGNFQTYPTLTSSCSASICTSRGVTRYDFLLINSGINSWFTPSGFSYKIRMFGNNSVLDCHSSGGQSSICQNIPSFKKGYLYNITFEIVKSQFYINISLPYTVYFGNTIVKTFNSTAPNQYNSNTYLIKNYGTNQSICLYGFVSGTYYDNYNGALFDNVELYQIGSFCDVGNCSNCVNQQPTQCAQCMNNFYLFNFTCPLCNDSISQCKNCFNNTFCIECYIGFTLLKNNTLCPLTNQSCFSYINNCASCQTILKCISCLAPYTVTNIGDQCFICSTQIPNCNACISKIKCAICAPGYEANKNYICVQKIRFNITNIYQSSQIDNSVTILTNFPKLWLQRLPIFQVIVNGQAQILIQNFTNQQGFVVIQIQLVSGFTYQTTIIVISQSDSILNSYNYQSYEYKMIFIEKYCQNELSYMNFLNIITIKGIYKGVIPFIKWVKYLGMGSMVNGIFVNFHLAFFYYFADFRIPKNLKITLERSFELINIRDLFQAIPVTNKTTTATSNYNQRISANSLPWKGQFGFDFTSCFILNNKEVIAILFIVAFRLVIFSLLYKISNWRVFHINYRKYRMLSMELQSFSPYILISGCSFLYTYLGFTKISDKIEIIFQMFAVLACFLSPFLQFVNSYINIQTIAKSRASCIKEKNLKEQKTIKQKIKFLKKCQQCSHLEIFIQNLILLSVSFSIGVHNTISFLILPTIFITIRIILLIKNFKLMNKFSFGYFLTIKILWAVYHLVFVCFYILESIHFSKEDGFQSFYKSLGQVLIFILLFIGIFPFIYGTIQYSFELKQIIKEFLTQYKTRNKIDPQQKPKSAQQNQQNNINNLSIFVFPQLLQPNKDINIGLKDDDEFDLGDKKIKKRRKVGFNQNNNHKSSITPQFFKSDNNQQTNDKYVSPFTVKVKHTKDSALKLKPYLITTYQQQ